MDERERSIIAAHEIGHAICGRSTATSARSRRSACSPTARRSASRSAPGGQRPSVRVRPARPARRADGRAGGRGAAVPRGDRRRVDDFDKANRSRRSWSRSGGWAATRRPPTAGTSGRGDLGFLVASSSGSTAVRGPGRRDAGHPRDPRRGLRRARVERWSSTSTRCAASAAYLVEHERLDGDTFDDLFEGRIDVPRATEEWRPTTSRPRAWDEVAVLADRRFPRVEPAPVAIAASQAEPVAAEPTPAVALTLRPSPETPAAVAPAPPTDASPAAAPPRRRLPRAGRGLAARPGGRDGPALRPRPRDAGRSPARYPLGQWPLIALDGLTKRYRAASPRSTT